MTFLFSEKYLVVVFVLLLAGSSAFLFWQNNRELDPNQGKDWWTLSFTDPQKTDALQFTVENHGAEAAFQYRITAGKRMYVEGTFELDNGETRTFTPDVVPPANTRTSITVTRDQDKKEIYR